MSMRSSRCIRIKRGIGPKGIASVSVDAATAARQYGPLGHDTGGSIQEVGEFYDIRAFQGEEPRPLYHSPTTWFEGLDKPTRQPLVCGPSQPPPEMLDQAPTASVSYHGEEVDFAELMRMFMAMAEGMDPMTYEPSPDGPLPAMPGPGDSATASPAMEAVIDEIAMNEPACYQVLAPAAEAVHEGTQTIEYAMMMGADETTAMPMAEDGLAALVEQQQEQATQSLEAMVQDQMSLLGPAVPEDSGPMEQPMMDMMLLDMDFGPGM